MHPRQATGFEWDDGNESELAQPHHPISPGEAEQVFLNGPMWAANKNQGTGEWKMIGFTDAGRALTLIVTTRLDTEDECLLRIITGWDCSNGEHAKYISKMRRP